MFNQNNEWKVEHGVPNGATNVRYSLATQDPYNRFVLIEETHVALMGSYFTLDLTDEQWEAMKNHVSKTSMQENWTLTFYWGNGTAQRSNSFYNMFYLDEDEARPVVTTSVSPVNEGYLSGRNIFVKYKSKVKLTVSAETRYNADVNIIRASLNRIEYGAGEHIIESFSLDPVNEVKTVVYDSRLIKSEETISFNVITYEHPYIVPVAGESTIVCQRIGNGVHAAFGVSDCSIIDGGVDINPVSAFYRYRPSTSEAFTSWSPLALSDREYNGVLPFEASDVITYIVEIKIEDKFNSDTMSFTIANAKVALHLGKGTDMVAIGKYCEREGFDVALKTYFGKAVQFDGDALLNGRDAVKDFILEQGYAVNDQGDTWYYRKYASGIAECFCTFEPTPMACSSPWGSLYCTADPIVVNFPSEVGFLWEPDVLASPVGDSSSFFLIGYGRKSESNTGEWYPVRPTSHNSLKVGIAFHAIGRWRTGGA